MIIPTEISIFQTLIKNNEFTSKIKTGQVVMKNQENP